MRQNDETFRIVNVSNNVVIRGTELIDRKSGKISETLLNTNTETDQSSVSVLIKKECEDICKTHRKMSEQVNQDTMNAHANDIKKATQSIDLLRKEINMMKNEINTLKSGINELQKCTQFKS
jgi:uncharacterized coiled-coil DUF342 family protein